MKWGTLSTAIKVTSIAFIAAGVLHLVGNLVRGDYPPAAIIFEGALVLLGLLAMTQRRWLVGLVTVVALAFAVMTILGLSDETGSDLAAGAAFALIMLIAAVAGGYAAVKARTPTAST